MCVGLSLWCYLYEYIGGVDHHYTSHIARESKANGYRMERAELL